MRHKTIALLFFCMSILLAAIAVVLGVQTLSGREQGPEQALTGSPASVSEAFTTPAPPPEPTAVPTPTAEPTPTPEPTATPWPGPVVPEQPVAVGAEYFADAGFLGNSVTSGLYLYNETGGWLLPQDTSHWYWANSLTIMGASSYVSQMADKQFGKIYIGFGINEVNYDKSVLRDDFNSVIDTLQADHPDAIIYIMSVTPVSKWCDSNRAFKRSAVLSFNEMLQEIALEQQVWYLDVYPVLCGDDGFLPSDVTNDGVHFTPNHYKRWFEYMTTHYIPDGTAAAAQPAGDVPANG